MKSLESVDRWLGKHFERWSASLAGGPHPKEALEIRREILGEVRDRIEPRGDGEYVFAYHEISVRLFARDAAQRDSFAASFLDDGALESQVREMLAEAGCRGDGVTVAIEIAEEAAEIPFKLDFRRGAKSIASAPGSKRPAAWLRVTKGKAEQAEYFVGKNVIYLGRLKEVSAKDGGLRRRNDVAFDDSETSVSREHAHIAFEEGRFRLYHDRGERGTRLFRDGRAVAVPTTGGRGTQLKSGDEIHLGEARVRFETGG